MGQCKLSNNDELVEEAPMTHSTLLAELPGIVEENDFSNDDAPIQELGLVDDSILAAQAAANANLTKTTGMLHEITGVTNGFNMPMNPNDNNDGEDEESEYANNKTFAIEEQIKDSSIEDVVDDDAYNNDADNNKEVENEEEAVDVNNDNEETEKSEDEDKKVLSQCAANHYNLRKKNNVQKQ